MKPKTQVKGSINGLDLVIIAAILSCTVIAATGIITSEPKKCATTEVIQ